jgi:hypothetical protein
MVRDERRLAAIPHRRVDGLHPVRGGRGRQAAGVAAGVGDQPRDALFRLARPALDAQQQIHAAGVADEAGSIGVLDALGEQRLPLHEVVGAQPVAGAQAEPSAPRIGLVIDDQQRFHLRVGAGQPASDHHHGVRSAREQGPRAGIEETDDIARAAAEIAPVEEEVVGARLAERGARHGLGRPRLPDDVAGSARGGKTGGHARAAARTTRNPAHLTHMAVRQRAMRDGHG